MEKTETLILPEDFGGEAPKVEKKRNPIENLKKKKETTLIIDERPRLPRTNREVPCIYCGDIRTLNPDQYQSYFDYWGTEEKITRNFECKPCEILRTANPFSFHLIYSEQTRKFIKGLKAIFELYKSSPKGQDDVTSLQNMTNTMAAEYSMFTGDFNSNCEFVIDPEKRLPNGLKVKNFPFVGSIEFAPYNSAVSDKIKFL